MKERSAGRILPLALSLAILVSLLMTMSPASAAPSYVVAAPGSAAAGYATRVVVLQMGRALTFVNLDIQMHDVVSTTPGLFSSAQVGLGKRTPVNGVQKLAKGRYKFYCSLHESTMKNNILIVI